MRIGVLSNPKAGRNRRRTARLRAFLQNQDSSMGNIVQVETDHYAQLHDALAVLARHEIDILVVYGGDGTLQRVLTEVLHTNVFPRLPLVAPLRGGRTNAGAAAIGSPASPVRAVSALIQAIHGDTVSDRIVEQPVLRIDVGHHEPHELQESVQYGLVLGPGVMYRTTELKHRILPDQYFQGVLGSAAFIVYVALVALFQSAKGGKGLVQADQIAIAFDGQAVEEDRGESTQAYLLMVITTLDHFFLNLRPFWGQENAPVRFTAIRTGAQRWLSSLIRLAQGKPPRAPGYMSRNVTRIELQLECGLFIDGELFPPQPNRRIRIEADRRIKFVRTD